MNESDHRTTIPATDVEQSHMDEQVVAKETPRFDSPVHIRVTSYRKNRHDPDGISVKAVLDGIVRAGILADDSSEQVKSIIFESRKSKEERTIIEIEEVDEK